MALRASCPACRPSPPEWSSSSPGRPCRRLSSILRHRIAMDGVIHRHLDPRRPLDTHRPRPRRTGNRRPYVRHLVHTKLVGRRSSVDLRHRLRNSLSLCGLQPLVDRWMARQSTPFAPHALTRHSRVKRIRPRPQILAISQHERKISQQLHPRLQPRIRQPFRRPKILRRIVNVPSV